MPVSVPKAVEPRQIARAAALLVAAGLVDSLDDALVELIAYHAADPRLIVVVEENGSTIGVGIGSGRATGQTSLGLRHRMRQRSLCDVSSAPLGLV